MNGPGEVEDAGWGLREVEELLHAHCMTPSVIVCFFNTL